MRWGRRVRPQRSLVRAEAAATSAAARSPGAPARRPWRRHPRKPGSRNHPAPGAQWAEHQGGQVTRGRGFVAPEPGKEVERERRAARGAEELKHPPLTDVIKAIDKDENIDYGDLNTCLQNFGVYLSKPEFQKITELTEAGVLPDAIENLHNLSKEKMSAPDLWNTLSSLKSNLKKDEFLAALKLATVDGEKVDTSDLEIFLQNMGIELTEDKGMELLNNLPVDAKRKVYMNRLMKELQSFKGTKVSLDKVDTVIKNMGIDLKEKEIQELKDHLPVDDEKVDLDVFMDAALLQEKS
ncbi:EF-hand calcium-binding domain-containing protein 13 [Tursiops truncatus]|uniref:EF-hand calcium-binding domain-containing protein 13 n=1 Tax=Tursiops truncatus TaxID=9739 RepID=UPI003CCF3473